jgi:hypothetical protein
MSAKPDDAASSQPPQGPGSYSQEFQHSQVSARVPEKVGRGIFSTGVLVLQGAHEFVLDFVQGMVQPRQVAARVVLPPSVVAGLLNALRENLTLYQNQFGPPPAVRPPAAPTPPPSIEEIYDRFKLPDEVLSGVYANAAMIVHTQTEFCLDFITNFYPRSAVSCRIFVAAPQIPVLLNSLAHAFQQYQQKLAAQANKPPAPPQPPPS